MTRTTRSRLDPAQLTATGMDMHRAVARTPEQEAHRKTGRAVAERLGYPAEELDRVPADALASFDGVGWSRLRAGAGREPDRRCEEPVRAGQPARRLAAAPHAGG